MRTDRKLSAFMLAMLFAMTGSGVSGVSAEVKLPSVIGNNMVLQRDKPVPIWGWAASGEKVTVTFADQTRTATADQDGAWKVTLDPLKAEPDQTGQTMVIKGSNMLTLENILIGEVWLCSGQSNMEQGMGMIDNSQHEISIAEFSKIRLFLVPKRPSGVPEKDVNATWRPCSSTTITQGGWGGFSGVAYFFGRMVYIGEKVPVGLIESAWGGTRIEPWTPPVGFASVPKLADLSRTVATAAPGSLNNHGQPTGLYNGMIHPLVPFAIRGAIWYQGESNMGEGMLYHEKMKALIKGWRDVWGQNDQFPFYFVQLAPFTGYGGGALPNIWEAQTATLTVPNTGMCVTTDITGNMGDIHPRNKQDVGRRLGLWALARTYRKTGIVYSGPLYQSMKIEGDKIRLFFAHTGSGLKSRDEKPLSDFSIAGESGTFVPATATIDDNTVIVHAPSATVPTRVQFGWYKTANPNLCNKEGLPAAPFRTENWQGGTGLPAGPAVVYAGRPVVLKDIRFHRKDPAGESQAELFYRATGTENFTSVPATVSSEGQLAATIPGDATGKPLDYYIQFTEAGHPPVTEPPEGAEAPRKVVPDMEPPTSVDQLAAAEVTDFRVRLQWKAATDDHEVAGYRIFRGDGDGFSTADDNAIGKVSGHSIEFSEGFPPAGKSVWYAVRAVDLVEREGEPSYFKADIPANRPPENTLTLSAVAAGNKAYLRWTGKPEPDVTVVEILRGEGKEGELKLLKEIKELESTAFADESVKEDTDYRYALRLRDRGDLRSPAGEPQRVRPGTYLKRINCGGDTFVGADGIPWDADNGRVSGTGRFNVKTAVSGADEDIRTMYQSERWSYQRFSYNFDLRPGPYVVVMHFAETNRNYTVKGKRTFDVYLGGKKVHEGVDIFDQVGANTAWQLSTEVDVTASPFVVELRKLKAGPALKGIEVRGLPPK